MDQNPGQAIIVPTLSVRNGGKAIEFYQEAFRAAILMSNVSPDGEVVAELEVKVADVQPTQGFVCLDTFDTPKGKRNVFDVMVEMTLECKPPEWPPMRIARHPRTDTEGGGALYCIDNRRLFMHKVLCVDSARTTARATEVAWMTEFDCKLKQAPPKAADRDRHWRTDDEGIAAAREELNRRLDIAQTLQDVSPQALQDVSAGALMRALAPKKDDELSQYREEMRSLLTRSVDSVGISEACLLEGVADLNEALLSESLSPPLPIYSFRHPE